MASIIKNNLPRYQDYVIRDGKFINDFEGLYQNFEDPWHQSGSDNLHDSKRALALNWCCRLREKYNVNRCVEIGCGFGSLTKALQLKNFSVVGIDVSQTAIKKARNINPDSVFIPSALSDFKTLQMFDFDIYLMAEISWYVLDDLDAFIENIRNQSEQRNRPVFLIHILSTYAPGVQKYGTDKFTNLAEILAYFKLDYLESGLIQTPRNHDANSQGTYFVAKI